MAKLYVVTLQEKNNARCEREVYVQAPGFAAAERLAREINPANLARPKAVAVRLLGDVY